LRSYAAGRDSALRIAFIAVVIKEATSAAWARRIAVSGVLASSPERSM
jgi:hypothetical protein